jgi:hypothetical protein
MLLIHYLFIPNTEPDVILVHHFAMLSLAG